jgi:hypothetical protein
VLAPPAVGWVVGTVEGAVATGVVPTVTAGIVGPEGATTGDAVVGGAMTGPEGAAMTPSSASSISSSLSLLSSSSLLSGWVWGLRAKAQRWQVAVLPR